MSPGLLVIWQFPGSLCTTMRNLYSITTNQAAINAL
jgi:hypothetical protein